MNFYDEKSTNELLESAVNLYNDADYVSLIKFSKEKCIDKLVKSANSLDFYLYGLENLIPYIRVFILVGIANYRLGKYKQAVKYFKTCSKILENLDRIIKFLCGLRAAKVLRADDKLRLRTFFKIKRDNKFLSPIIYAYIAHAQLKMSDFARTIESSINYRNAFIRSNELNLNSDEHKEIYIDILLGRSDAYYELTKMYITAFKILVFIISMFFIVKLSFSQLSVICFNLYEFSNPFLFFVCLIFIIMTFPKVLYKTFYFPLRKLRRLISVNFLKLFPESFCNKLINLLNFINLKKFFSYKTHTEAIEIIEGIGQKNFNTFFAIAKLYYCLGQYKNSTFYIQRALSYHNEKNKSELAMSYHYLARIAYKTSNNLTAIDFYDKAIENLMSINKTDSDFRFEYLPSISDMIQYTQENRNKIEQTTFSRTYLPLIITLIITMLVCVAQIYYSLPNNENQAINVFKTIYELYIKLITP